MTDPGSNRVVSHSKDLLDVGKKSTVLGESRTGTEIKQNLCNRID